MSWYFIDENKPDEKQEIEFPANKERDGIIQGIYSNGIFWSSFDGYHEPRFWRPYHPNKGESSSESIIKGIREIKNSTIVSNGSIKFEC